jgi:hypothetical protein
MQAEECKLLAEHLGCFCFSLPDLGLNNGLVRLLGCLSALRAVRVCGEGELTFQSTSSSTCQSQHHSSSEGRRVRDCIGRHLCRVCPTIPFMPPLSRHWFDRHGFQLPVRNA